MTLTAIHPGEHLAEELEALDMSAAELARKIDVPTNSLLNNSVFLVFHSEV
jgi:plasmid maintenance system antidote protein VapI